MFYCLNVQLYHLLGESRFVCAHIGQKRDIYPPSIIRGTFWLVHPLPLFRRLTVGAAIEKNFFDFYFSDSLSCSYWLLLWFSFYTRLITIWIYFISLRITASIWFLDFVFPILNSYSYFNFLFFLFSRLVFLSEFQNCYRDFFNFKIHLTNFNLSFIFRICTR